MTVGNLTDGIIPFTGSFVVLAEGMEKITKKK